MSSTPSGSQAHSNGRASGASRTRRTTGVSRSADSTGMSCIGPILGDDGPAGYLHRPPQSTGDRRAAECLGRVMTPSDSPVSRRAVIGGSAAAAVALSVVPATSAWARPLRLDYPFTLGVASGDPEPTSVVLWTRLAPAPFTRGHGMRGHDKVTVRWEVAVDEGMRFVVKRGQATTYDAWAHSVHVEAKGLRPGHEYWYRFEVAGHVSPVGRTRTAPAAVGLGGGPDLRVRVVPGLRLRVLHVLPPHRRGRPRLRAAPRRLRLRVRHERDGREPRDARAPDRAAGAEHPRAVAGHARALQAGPEPAGGAPAAAVRADVGRPRVLQRLRRRRARSGRRRCIAPAGGVVPGVLGAPAAAGGRTLQVRRDPDLPPAVVREAAAARHDRRSPVPVRAALRLGRGPGLRGGVRPGDHHARAPGRSSGCTPGCPPPLDGTRSATT